MPTVPFTLLPGATPPRRATPGAAGLDLHAYLPGGAVLIDCDERHVIPAGLRLALPPGYEGQVRPRSGLALNHGLTVLNAPGTVDSDYRGEVAVILFNHGHAPVTIRHGDRIAQLVIAPVAAVELTEAADLPPTERGAGGFGSTGTGPVDRPEGLWSAGYCAGYDDGREDYAALEAHIRRLEADLAEARAERDKWAAELDGERAATAEGLRMLARACRAKGSINLDETVSLLRGYACSIEDRNDRARGVDV